MWCLMFSADPHSPEVCSLQQNHFAVILGVLDLPPLCCQCRATCPEATHVPLSHPWFVLRAPLLLEGFARLCSLLGKKKDCAS